MKKGRLGHGALGIILALALAFSTIFWSGGALAIPIFQTYIQNAIPDTIGQDQTTWFSTSNSFNLLAVGAYTGDTLSIEDMRNATLLISVPQGETGTISVGGLTPLTSAPGTGALADISILNNISGSNAYQTLSFLPADITNALDPLHYPLVNPGDPSLDISNFLIYNLGTLTSDSGVNDYNAATKTITTNAGTGEERLLNVAFSGFSQLHFDLYGLITTREVFSEWVINPDSHDATAMTSAAAVPEPGTLVLLITGLAGLGLFGRRRMRVSEA